MTANELLTGRNINAKEMQPILIQTLIDFAKYHVRNALIEASQNAVAKENPADYGTGEIWVDKQSIINAYPLTNIK